MRISLLPSVAAVLLLVPAPTPRAETQAAPVSLRILAINDFHGNLRPPAGGIRIADPVLSRIDKISTALHSPDHVYVKQLGRFGM